jgi:hypothetical protein
MIEFLITTLLFEKLRQWFKRSPRNNKVAIAKMNLPTFENVGELRKLLLNFSDDVPTQGGSFRYPHLQVREVDNIGLICFGSSSHRSEKTK